MYYYAVLNTKDIVEYISEQETEVTYYEYISIPTADQSLVGKWYDREGLYGTVGAFLEAPISILAEHSSSQISYKGQDVWLDDKLDSYVTQSNLSSELEGKANVSHSHNAATKTVDGFMSAGDKAKLDGIEANANLYVHPETHAASMITGLSAVSTSGSYNDLTDKPTIPTIPAALPADGGNADTLDGYHAAYFASGQHNHDGVYAAANHTHDYAASNHSHATATTTAAGFMSKEDKAKLNGIASGANSYTHPASHPASMITETDSLKVMTAAERTKLSGIAENANNYTHPETHSAAMIEETSLKKVMTAEERTKLAGIESGANNYSHPSTHPASMITGLSDIAISGSYEDLSNKPTSMSPTAHTHAQSEITGLETALSGKASSTHTHAQSDITGLATALSGKSDTSHTHTAASTSVAGFMSAADKTKLNGIAANANAYTHPSTHAASMITGLADVATSGSYDDLSDKPTIPAAYTHPSTHPASMITGLADIATSGSYNDLSDTPTSMTPKAHTHAQSDITGLATALSGKSDTSHSHSNATTTAAGFMSKDDKSKLDGIATGANKTTVDSALSSTSTNPVQNKVINTALSGKAASSHTHSVATTSAAGFMSKDDKTKLNGIATGANNYTHPSTHAASMITGLAEVATSGSYTDLTDKPTSMTPTAHSHAQSDITGLATALSGKSDTTHTHSAASTTANGFMSKEDKTKLNGIATGANKTTVDSALSSTSTNPVQNKVINTALAGKASTSHNHNSAYIAKSLQMTADDGDVLVSWTNQDVVAKIKALPTGMYTAYAKAGTTNNPKTTESWRFLVHKTSAVYGWVQAFGAFGSMYIGYVDNSNWKGWKCVFDADPAPLWTGKLYMSGSESSPQTVTPSKKLSECRTGYLLVWSDYDPDTSTANDADFVTTFIPKKNPTGGNWSGKSFLCDIPRYIGSNVNDVDTERRIMKILYIYDNRIVGSPNNSKDDRNDVVLRAVYEF